MSRRKKKQHHEEHMDESWLLPYADLLTLLLALFIVLFAMSSVDAQKFQKLSKAFNDVFTGGTGVLEFPSPMPEGQMQSTDAVSDKPSEEPEEYAALDKLEKEQLKQAADQEELAALQEKVDAFIENKNLAEKLETSLTTEGLLVSIRDNVLFSSGSADVRTEDLKIATEIAELLVMDPPRNIIISGHTDNVPIRNSSFESNWELSVMRAVNFMKIILHNEKLDPRWFSAKGFGEFQPVSDNKIKEGRAKNRRVEILILPRAGNQP
ncbi:flagellar motor protein MotB [Cytobacillus sp. NCCP-133]|uniref:flagellar motor protein MotB n=1 Tax=Cytobacillus sp. NCCP-133 TaxID=766848 RepID=UPI00222FF65A|nr:flagellar motor protein MotB [Cytobacillus sp. NCCP-133]GLB59945.1 motility protein B [Cytobacillus sp. NCCP-133]